MPENPVESSQCIPNTRSLQIEEVKGVTQVLDQEEEIAMQEFAKFEAKLKERKSNFLSCLGSCLDKDTLIQTSPEKGPGAIASTAGRGNLDTVGA